MTVPRCMAAELCAQSVPRRREPEELVNSRAMNYGLLETRALGFSEYEPHESKSTN